MLRRKHFGLIGTIALTPLAVYIAQTLFADAFTAPVLSLFPFLIAILIYPLLEEFVFRALLHTELSRIDRMRMSLLPGISLANASVAFVFALAHVLLRSDPALWFVALPALVIGYHFEDYGRNWRVAAGLHIWFNTVWFSFALTGLVGAS